MGRANCRPRRSLSVFSDVVLVVKEYEPVTGTGGRGPNGRIRKIRKSFLQKVHESKIKVTFLRLSTSAKLIEICLLKGDAWIYPTRNIDISKIDKQNISVKNRICDPKICVKSELHIKSFLKRFRSIACFFSKMTCARRELRENTTVHLTYEIALDIVFNMYDKLFLN